MPRFDHDGRSRVEFGRAGNQLDHYQFDFPFLQPFSEIHNGGDTPNLLENFDLAFLSPLYPSLTSNQEPNPLSQLASNLSDSQAFFHHCSGLTAPNDASNPAGLASTAHPSWKWDQQQTHYRSISFRSDLPYSYKCVDWSTIRQGFDLVATGTLTGRAFLVTLPYAHHPPSKPELYSPHPIISFSTAKSNCPCNSIAFSPCGKLLALALDKARDYGLQIFDKTRELVISPHPNSFTEPHSDQLLSAQALNAEAVHALEYMLVTAGSAQPALLTASSSKLIGIYDLRSPGTNQILHPFSSKALSPMPRPSGTQWPPCCLRSSNFNLILPAILPERNY
ncbi:hypothetical protein PCASD_15519 [Puccinia coronata f. sp. avenae]|uniref:Uncharacterized protein n=1 Tax=Puccinia coronata f. sp. avenae TaxID=200324 RepID=A0A2N5UCB1_9BASI|nr:hypothetical protein PCASD_15519 [Puccinia coronata f. sp. avenae]